MEDQIRPSQWIMERAKEKAINEREGENDLIHAGVLSAHRYETEDEHIRARMGWFVSEAIAEYLDMMDGSIRRIESICQEILNGIRDIGLVEKRVREMGAGKIVYYKP